MNVRDSALLMRPDQEVRSGTGVGYVWSSPPFLAILVEAAKLVSLCQGCRHEDPASLNQRRQDPLPMRPQKLQRNAEVQLPGGNTRGRVVQLSIFGHHSNSMREPPRM